MRKYVVTFKIGEREAANCTVMTGNELARTYGFSDCTGIKMLKVWEVQADGNLIGCDFWGSCYEPYNVLYVHRFGNYEPYEYEWEEH